jgi:thiosulfate/3-mercaptopyruvate sulfurtransferase
MKKLLTAIFITIAVLVQAGTEKPVLVPVQWLKEHLHDPDLVLVQVTFLKLDYDREHIEGAMYLWPEWLAPNTPEGSYNAPDVQKATALLRSYGINENSHVVLYHVRNEVSPTARMFLTLENLGLRGKVSFLNGGLEAWKKEGLPVTSKVPPAKKGNIVVKQGDILVNKDYVLKALNSDKALVVDARIKLYFDGEPVGNPRDGHIKGAANLPYPDLLDDNNMFKPVDSLKVHFDAVTSSPKEMITYCFIGQTASVVYMAGRILGYDMKLYDGSMQEWSRIPELPMEKTEKKE